jgi:hypothetical protein
MMLEPFRMGPQPSEDASSESSVEWPCYIHKMVKTPDGLRAVIVDTAVYMDAQRKSFEARFMEGEDGLYRCRRCSRLTSLVSVVHYRARVDDWNEELISPYEAATEDIVYQDVVYCFTCDPVPESPGFAIAPYGSYYNRPH